MAETTGQLYEALILLNQQAVASDFGGCVEHVREIFRRAEAEVDVLRKWDERKLAYEIAGQKRGTFLLAYFHAEGGQIANIERDCSLSEQVLRVLIIRADHIGDVELELARRDAELSLEVRAREGDGRGRPSHEGEDQTPPPPRPETAAQPAAEAVTESTTTESTTTESTTTESTTTESTATESASTESAVKPTTGE